VQIVAPAFDFKPSAQLVQAAELVWAVAAENLPAAQFVQKGEASAAEYVPAAQLSHAALPLWISASLVTRYHILECSKV